MNKPAETPRPSTLVIVLTGDVGKSWERELAEHLQDFTESGASDASVDLSSVTSLGSPGITFLAELGKAAASCGGRVCLVQPSEHVVRILKILTMLAFFDIEPSTR